jgi:hypothetical protein
MMLALQAAPVYRTGRVADHTTTPPASWKDLIEVHAGGWCWRVCNGRRAVTPGGDLTFMLLNTGIDRSKLGYKITETRKKFYYKKHIQTVSK